MQLDRPDRWSVSFALGLALAVAGIALSATSRGTILNLNPGVLGAFTAGLVGIVLAGLQGLRYTAIVTAMVPIFAWQAAAGVWSTPAIIGEQIAALGILGLIIATRTPRPAASKTASRRRASMVAASTTSLR